ncbi:MAG: 3-dehydroquinate synthase, partial [Pseudomonadota bacterium]
MKVLEIANNTKYKIIIGNEIVNNISNHINFAKYSKILILIDRKVYELWWSDVKTYLPSDAVIIQVEDGEVNKNITNATQIWNQMIEKGFDRKSIIINFGGGMVSDLGGFVASTYMRGIDFINIPTTLLSAVDASIGGKVAVNLNNTKNIIGCFANPILVLVDIKFFSTLPNREFQSGMAEIVKHALICNENYANQIIEFANKKCNIIDVIFESLKIKKHIVELDFKEKAERKLLNFGHTIGHAFESVAMQIDKSLLHGEAVAIGMIIESKIALKLGVINESDANKIQSFIINVNLFSLNSDEKANYNINSLIDYI